MTRVRSRDRREDKKRASLRVHTTLAAGGSLAQPEVDVLVIQERQAEAQSQQVEEVVVARQNDENLKQNLQNKQNAVVISLFFFLDQTAGFPPTCR